jgi:hypothetical protein
MSFSNLNNLLKQKIKNEFCSNNYKLIQNNILISNLTHIETYLKNFYMITYCVQIKGWDNYKQNYILICDKTNNKYLYKNWEFKTSNEFLHFINLKYALIGLENNLYNSNIKVKRCIFKIYENNKYIYINNKVYIYTKDIFNMGLFLEL